MRLTVAMAIVVLTLCRVLVGGIPQAFALPGYAQYKEQGQHEQPASYNPFTSIGLDQRLNEQIPLDLTFRDETGKSVRLNEYFGDKPVILSLAYYDCSMLCSLVINGLIRTLRTLNFSAGNEFTVLTISFNPRNTSEMAAEKKKTSLGSYQRAGAENGWHFLTGDEEAIQQLTQAVGFRYTYDEKVNQYMHASGIMVLTPQGKLARYFYGVEYAPRDLRLGLVEASAGRIGSAVDQILLLCYHYDPVTGKYGLLITRSLQISGGVMMLALGSYMFIMFRRDWRTKPPEQQETSALVSGKR